MLGINLLPAFGPPTWSVIALYAFNSDLELVPLVLLGAIAAATGRFLLAHATRLLGARYLPDRILANLDAAREALEKRRRNSLHKAVQTWVT